MNLSDTPLKSRHKPHLIAKQVQGGSTFYDHTIDMQAKGKCFESIVLICKPSS